MSLIVVPVNRVVLIFVVLDIGTRSVFEFEVESTYIEWFFLNENVPEWLREKFSSYKVARFFFTLNFTEVNYSRLI